ncbi:GAP1-M domain-containing protein [Nocardia jejuensis]|uniref:GAP1-M domain-containing protein n=1 Tax=Nocardia jejuensis TaxID=328049 RepID=UPI000834CCF2|nr:hypothetical protein [Nocardia jejuensis]
MTRFPQLLCGWALVNLEDSGTGVGVVSRSENWPAAVGSTARELGPLVTMAGDNQPGEVFALDFTLVRGTAIASLKTPSSARPGTCITHLIAGEPGQLDGSAALWLFASGDFLTALDSKAAPNDRWEPVVSDEPADHDAYATALLDEIWLPVLIGRTLAHLSGQGPAIALHVNNAEDAITMLRALYGSLPRNALRELTFSTYAEQAPDLPAIVAVLGADAVPSDARHVVTPSSRAEGSTDPYLSLGLAIVEQRKAGLAPPDSLTGVHEIREWLHQQQLRTVEPALLDDAQLAKVLTGHELSPDWFTDEVVARRAIHLALEKPSVARALARIEHKPETRATFEKTLTEHVMSDEHGPGRATQVAAQLGVDISDVVAAAAWQRVDSGTLSASDARSVWPRIKKEWATGDSARRGVVIERLRRHRVLREYAADSRDRFLVYETVLAEIEDPAVRTGASALVRNAVFANLPIVAQLVVNMSGAGRDHRALEEIMACAPGDRLGTLLAECARYPAVDATELLRAAAAVRPEQAQLVAALTPAWPALRGCLGLPEPIEILVALDATATDPLADQDRKGGFRLPRKPFRRRDNQARNEVAAIVRLALEDPRAIEEARDVLAAAVESDTEFVASCMADISRLPGGASVLLRILGNAPREQVPALIAACAQQPEVETPVLLRATAALRLDPTELAGLLAGGWPWLRAGLGLPDRVAALLVLDPSATEPRRLRPLSAAQKQQQTRWQFWR